MVVATLVAAVAAPFAPDATASDSRCYGSVGNGRIERSVKLPPRGPNFSAYSTLGASLGRTHVHSKVATIVLDAYAALAREQPVSP